ncbi:hypothetical protein JCM10296v2_001891 [Rhodotorula toruloides]
MAALSPALASANSPLASSSPDLVIPASHWSGTPSASPSKRRKGKGRAEDRRESVLSERDANEGLLVDVQSASGFTPAANKTLFPPRTPSAFALSLLDKSPSLLKAQLSAPLIPLGTPITVRKKVHPPSERKENETPSTRRSARRAGIDSPSPAGTAASSPEKTAPSSPKTVRYSPSPRRLRSSPRKPAAQTPLATSSTSPASGSPTPAPTPSTPIHHLGLAPTALSVSPFAHFSPSTPAIRTHASYRDEELTDCDADGSYWDVDEDVSLSWSNGPSGSAESTEVVQGGEVEADEVDEEMAIVVGRLSLDAPVDGDEAAVADESVELTPTEVEDNDTVSDGEDVHSATSDEKVEVAAVLEDDRPTGVEEPPLAEADSSSDAVEIEPIEQAALQKEVDTAPTTPAVGSAVDTTDPCDDVAGEAAGQLTPVEGVAVSDGEPVEEASPAEEAFSAASIAPQLDLTASSAVEDERVHSVESASFVEEDVPPALEEDVALAEPLVVPSSLAPSPAECMSSGNELDETEAAIDAGDVDQQVMELVGLEETPIAPEQQVEQPIGDAETATAALEPKADAPSQDQIDGARAGLGGDGFAIAWNVSLGGAEARWCGGSDRTGTEFRQPACEACRDPPSFIRFVVVDIVHSLKQLEHIGTAFSRGRPAFWGTFDLDSRDELVHRESAPEYNTPSLFPSAVYCANKHSRATCDYLPSSPLPATHRSAPYPTNAPTSRSTALTATSSAPHVLSSREPALRPPSASSASSMGPPRTTVRAPRAALAARKAADAASTPSLNLSVASPSKRRAGRIIDGKLQIPRTPAVPPTPSPAALPPVETPSFPPRPATPTQPDVPAPTSAPTPSASPSPSCASPRRLAAHFPQASPHRSPRRILVDQPTLPTENQPPTPSTALLAPAEKLATEVSTTIFEPSARPASVRATRRTRLADIQATAPPTTDAPDAVTEPPATLRSSRRTIAVAPAQTEPAAEPAVIAQPKTPILRTRRSRLRLLTEEAAAASAAESTAEPEPTVQSSPAPADDAQPATARPLPSFRPAPAATQDELNRLTQRNTKKNQVAFNRIKLETVFLDCPRPPSPTSKIRKAFGSEGSLGRTTTKEGREARAAKRRNALRSSLDGSELAALAEELKAESGSSMEAEPPKQHFRAAGDDEQYFTPQKAGGALKSAAAGRKRSPGSGSSSANASPRRQEAKRVKWDRALVYEGPLDREARSNGDSILKPVDLDAWGNSTSIASLGKPTSITIRMRVFKDEQ